MGSKALTVGNQPSAEKQRRVALWAKIINILQTSGVHTDATAAALRKLVTEILDQRQQEARERLALLEQEGLTSPRELRLIQEQIDGNQRAIERMRNGDWANDDAFKLLKEAGLDTYLHIAATRESQAISYQQTSVANPIGKAFVINTGSTGKADSGSHWQPVLNGQVQHAPGDGKCGFHTLASILNAHVPTALEAMPELAKQPKVAPHAPALREQPLPTTGDVEAKIVKQTLQRDLEIATRRAKLASMLGGLKLPALQQLIGKAHLQESNDRVNGNHNSRRIATFLMCEGTITDADAIRDVLANTGAHMDSIYGLVVAANASTTRPSQAPQKFFTDRSSTTHCGIQGKDVSRPNPSSTPTPTPLPV